MTNIPAIHFSALTRGDAEAYVIGGDTKTQATFQRRANMVLGGKIDSFIGHNEHAKWHRGVDVTLYPLAQQYGDKTVQYSVRAKANGLNVISPSPKPTDLNQIARDAVDYGREFTLKA